MSQTPLTSFTIKITPVTVCHKPSSKAEKNQVQQFYFFAPFWYGLSEDGGLELFFEFCSLAV
jgi:hypothetical protein